ncbi:MAG: DNA gyrase C-terminal beta-propeller domain-containing protein, partial [Rhodospirillales bacterium]
GYVKRVPLSTYRAQRRGGKGRSGMATRDEDFVSQVFVANTHTPMLFFSSAGMVYKMKVYRLPVGTPQARGKAFINLLPLKEGETISTVMPLPEDESTWGDLFVMFATASGYVRRNALSDFTDVRANGKIAMKFEGDYADDQLVRVRVCTEDDDILLSAAGGKCIRFPVPDVRVFSGRSSHGVRGMRLPKGDELIALSVVRHVKVETDDRDAYLQARNAARRLKSGDYTDRAEDKARDTELAARLEEPKFADMVENEQFILTLTDDGYGKRTSAYEYRISGRGGQGVGNINVERAGSADARVVAAFGVLEEDQLVMVSNGGQIIRVPVHGISIYSRSSRGVRVFNTAEDERVVSVSRLRDVQDDGEDDDDMEDGEGEAPGVAPEEASAETLDDSPEAPEEEQP